ncbi:MAG: hypothetical protein FJY85_17135 [Deltaproteobacteria bacterium]|nr:hypothetical protein [Deltaproteobacteria bacterium]
MKRAKSESRRIWTSKEVLERAARLFPGVKPRKSGAGNYSAAQLAKALESLKKEG